MKAFRFGVAGGGVAAGVFALALLWPKPAECTDSLRLLAQVAHKQAEDAAKDLEEAAEKQRESVKNAKSPEEKKKLKVALTDLEKSSKTQAQLVSRLKAIVTLSAKCKCPAN
jgi:hypothetical protein